jgi:hypothetical protein
MKTRKQWVCENEKCGWIGPRPATLRIPGLKVKVCQNCLKSCIHQEEVAKEETTP